MNRRSPRLAALHVVTTTTTHSQRVMQYYLRLLETVYDPTERIGVAISAFEYIFQNWPTLNWSHPDHVERLKMAMANMEAILPELHDVHLCKKLRITTLFQELHTLFE